MALDRSDGPAPARIALTKATDLIQKQFPRPDRGDLGREWQDQVIAEILLHEASLLVERDSRH
jgi:hypothetical protein